MSNFTHSTETTSSKHTSSFVCPAATKVHSATQVPPISMTPGWQAPPTSEDGVASPTDQWRWLQTGAPTSLSSPIAPFPVQTLPQAPSGCHKAEPLHGIPMKRMAQTHHPLVTWLSQPYGTHARDLTEARMSQYLPVTEHTLNTCYRYVRQDILTLFPSLL